MPGCCSENRQAVSNWLGFGFCSWLLAFGSWLFVLGFGQPYSPQRTRMTQWNLGENNLPLRAQSTQRKLENPPALLGKKVRLRAVRLRAKNQLPRDDS